MKNKKVDIVAHSVNKDPTSPPTVASILRLVHLHGNKMATTQKGSRAGLWEEGGRGGGN